MITTEFVLTDFLDMQKCHSLTLKQKTNFLGGVWTVFSGCFLRSAPPESAAAFIPAPTCRLNPTGNYHAQPRPMPVLITGVGLRSTVLRYRNFIFIILVVHGVVDLLGRHEGSGWKKMARQLTPTRDWSA